MSDTLQMTVSPICVKDDQKYAFVSFRDDERSAEGRIPECIILSNQGFDDGEVLMLENYMKQNLADLKKMAARLNAFDAMRK